MKILNIKRFRSTPSRSTYLFVTPGIVDGLAEVFNVAGLNHVRYSMSTSEGEADFRALSQDWAAVADDLRRSYECHTRS